MRSSGQKEQNQGRQGSGSWDIKRGILNLPEAFIWKRLGADVFVNYAVRKNEGPILLFISFVRKIHKNFQIFCQMSQAMHICIAKKHYWQSVSEFEAITSKFYRAVGRGVTKLDGARGKKQVWRPYVRTWGLSEANVLYWREYLWHCWNFWPPLAVIWRPHLDSAPGELFPPSLRPWQLVSSTPEERLTIGDGIRPVRTGWQEPVLGISLIPKTGC